MLIAEIGQNFQGDLQLALEMIIQAHKNGADLVKFQLYDSKKLYGEYQNTELTFQDAHFLFNAGAYEGIEVFFSVFDTERVKWCEEIGVKRYKIAYRCWSEELLKAIEATDKSCFLSFDYYDIIDTKSPVWAYYGFRHNYRSGRWKTLYCPSGYPQEIDADNLFINIKFSGISDHTIGLSFAKRALEISAKSPKYPCDIIEKHFAIDHKTGVDAEWSMTPEELKELKRFELACGDAL